MNMTLKGATLEQLRDWEADLARQYDADKAKGLQLDLTRGKPSSAQLDLANALDGCLNGHYVSAGGVDVRNYGGLDGLPELKQLAAEVLETDAAQVLVGGNSSLTLMYQAMLFAWLFGPSAGGDAWRNEGTVKFICPVPGYDRHFGICEALGIEMLCVPMLETGPDMDQVESLIANDPSIKGMWNVPKYANPTGTVYSDDTVRRIARLGKIAANNFRVFWDNAYVVHDLVESAPALLSISQACEEEGTQDSVYQFASTSKITHAGAGVAFMAASESNLASFKKHLSVATIGPDKINQLRHAKLIANKSALMGHMQQHRALLKPKFDLVLSRLEAAFSGSDLGRWTQPQGGYFISFDAKPQLASTIVKMAGDVGVKLTQAGAPFPYGKDPLDANIRLAPSFPALEEIEAAIDVFILCVKLASVRQAIVAMEA